MADMPMIRSRNMQSLMSQVVESHSAIRAAIHLHAQEVQAARDAMNEKQNADAKVGYKARAGR